MCVKYILLIFLIGCGFTVSADSTNINFNLYPDIQENSKNNNLYDTVFWHSKQYHATNNQPKKTQKKEQSEVTDPIKIEKGYWNDDLFWWGLILFIIFLIFRLYQSSSTIT